MFTGIIEARAKVVKITLKKSGIELVVEKPRSFGAPRLGSSIAVNGVCLTVVRSHARQIIFQIVSETLKRSNLGRLLPGQQVNLERALAAKDRIEGHFVLGHVDAVGVVREIRRRGIGIDFKISFPSTLKTYVIEKGSIGVNGVSLTLGKTSDTSFWIHAIPHTLKVTGMGAFKVGQRVNLEADILLKFLHRLMIS